MFKNNVLETYLGVFLLLESYQHKRTLGQVSRTDKIGVDISSKIVILIFRIILRRGAYEVDVITLFGLCLDKYVDI